MKIIKEVVGNATLYCGDMRDVLPRLGQCAHCIITDNPYKLTSGGRSTRPDTPKGILGYREYDNKGELCVCNITTDEYIPLCYRAVMPNSHTYFMADSKNLPEMLSKPLKYGYKYHNTLYWKKNNATPNRWGMKNTEFIGLFYKGRSPYFNNCGTKQSLEFPNIIGNKPHPNQKPVELMEVMVNNSSQPNEVILDPFMGSGSTGIAAIKNNRKFIGVEIEEEAFEIALKRIKEVSGG